ncbi:MAG: phosphatase PAP2 family protein [Acidimicrobiales bacterium]
MASPHATHPKVTLVTVGEMDFALYNVFNRLAARTSWAHPIVIAYAKYGIALFAALLVAGLIVGRHTRAPVRSITPVLWAGLAALIALAVNQGIGHLVRRPRPYVTHPHVHVLIAKTSDFSFPSDHTVVAAAVAGALFLASIRLGVISAALAVVMAFARVYVGAHYPGDVFAGLVIGSIIAIVLWPFASRLLRPLVAGIAQRAPGLIPQEPARHE